MLPRKHRLDTANLKIVLEKGKKAYGEAFSVSYIKTPVEGAVAVIVSKKVNKTSVGRHRIKRRISSVIEKVGVPEAKVAIFVQKKALDMKIDELKAEYERFLGML